MDAGPVRGLVDSMLADIHLLLAHYMRALVLLSLATFTAYGIFFTIMGVPFGILLAVVAMVLEFIPMIGSAGGGGVDPDRGGGRGRAHRCRADLPAGVSACSRITYSRRT